MWKAYGGLCVCWLAKRNASSHACNPTPVGGTALGEATQQDDASREAEQRMQPGASTSGRTEDSPPVLQHATVKQLRADAAGGLGAQRSNSISSVLSELRSQLEETQQQHPGQHSGGKSGSPVPLLAEAPSFKSVRQAAPAVRFVTSNGQLSDLSGTDGPASAARGTTTARGPATAALGISGKTSRVRLLLPTDSGKSSRGSDGGREGDVAARNPVAPSASAASSSRKLLKMISSLGEPRALAQLTGLLLAHHVDYRSDLEGIMATHGSAFPSHLLEEMLNRNGVAMPQKRLRLITILYRADEARPQERARAGANGAAEAAAGRDTGEMDAEMGGGKIDGVALLKDLDRAAFRHIALGISLGSHTGSGVAGGNSPVPPSGTSTAASSRKALMAPGQLGDKARILQLVATKLAEDESLRIRAGSDEVLTPEHIQEVVEQIDLTSVAVPVGIRAPYVPSTEYADSFQVPVWSLRAMHLRKQQRERLLAGSDPHLRRLGQAGREALKKTLTSRSLMQQQEIIASAVVAAARAAVVPAARLAENSIQLSGPSRGNSLQRTGSRNIGGSAQRLSASTVSTTTDTAAAAAAKAVVTAKVDGSVGGGGGGEVGQKEERQSVNGGTGVVGAPGSSQAAAWLQTVPRAPADDGGRESGGEVVAGTLSTGRARPPSLGLGDAGSSSSSSSSGGGGGGDGVGAALLPGGGASSTLRTKIASQECDDDGSTGISSGTGDSAGRPSLTSLDAAVLGVTSRKALGSAGGDAMILPVVVVTPTCSTELQQPPSASSPRHQPPPSQTPMPQLQVPQRQSQSVLQDLLSQLQLHSAELSVAGEELRQLPQQPAGVLPQSASPDTAVQAAVQCTASGGSPHAPHLLRSVWEGGGGAGGSSGGGDGGSSAVNEGRSERKRTPPGVAAANNVSTGASNSSPSKDRSGDGNDGESMSWPASTPAGGPVQQPRQRHGCSGREPHHMPEADLLQVHEAAVHQRALGKEHGGGTAHHTQ